MNCEEMRLLLQAEIDDELGPAEVAAVVAHRASCPRCAARYAQLRSLKDDLRGHLERFEAPDSLRKALEARLAPPPAPRKVRRSLPWLPTGLGFGAGALASAALLLLVVMPRGPDFGDLVVAGHVRALQASHLEDVISTDRHTVKPWFDGKLDFAPPVKDLADQGFPLTGGRLDYLDRRPVAALVYTRRLHPINLFVWPAADRDAHDTGIEAETRDGFNLLHWRERQMEIWVVSDLNQAELGEFVARWRAAS
jgi:anti-sigma factor RsiW